MIGYALTGSFCTFSRSIAVLSQLVSSGEEVQPIMSETAYTTDTRFGAAKDFVSQIERICGRKIIHTVKDAEPLGPKAPLETLIIAPCTGNTLAKLASGITDTAVTMAAKAHLRQDRRLLVALSTNDGMSQNLGNIARLLTRRAVYFVPLVQDDIKSKPHSLVASFERIPEALAAARENKQLRPLFI